MKRFATALGFLLTIATAQAEAPFAKDVIIWNKPSAPFKITNNIYYVGTADLAIFLIVTPKGNILIDGGVPESVPLIEKNITALGFKLSDIKILLNSHAHFDHAGGLAQLKKDTGAKLIASALDTPILKRGYVTFGPSTPIHIEPVAVDRQVHDGDTVKLGGVTLTANLTPGHTPGCTSWSMTTTVDGSREPHQAVFYCSTTVAGNPLIGNTEYPQIASDYRKSFAKLKAMKADIFLAAHARFFEAHAKAARAKTGGANPFVVPGELQRYVAASEKDFAKEFAEQKAKAAH